MSNVVDLMELLPIRVRDTRIVSLHAAFGQSRFDVFQASDALGMSIKATWDLLFYGPMLKDGVYKVAGDNGGFRLLSVAPEREALPEWRDRYLPIMRSLSQPFGAQAFADVACIPYPSANYLLSLFQRHEIILSHFNGESSLYRVKPRRRVIMAATERPRRVIYTGH